MKLIFSFVLILYACSFTVSGAEFVLPEYEKIRLENGLTIYLLEQHEVPLVDVTFTVKVGATADTKPGLAQITAQNLLLGTQNVDKAGFEEALDFVGAEVNANANLERTLVSASFTKTDIDEVLPLIVDAVLKPAFNQEEFEKHKKRYLSLLVQAQESPRAIIRNYFNAQIFQGHPYANQVDGNTGSVSSIELTDIKAFHTNWYTPGNSALVIAGDFDIQKIKQSTKQLFNQWQGQTKKLEIPSQLPTLRESKVLLINKPDATETRFLVGGYGGSKSNPDLTAISVINTILGARFSSWLNDELRINSGLTYGARSRFDSKALGGSFSMSTFTKTETTEDTMDLLLKTYARLWEKGIDQATLDSAKAYVKGRYPPRFETSQNLARLLSDMFVYNYDEQLINTFDERVDQLDLDKTKTLIKTYFPKDKLQFTIIGKAESIEKMLEKYGNVQTINIKDSAINFN